MDFIEATRTRVRRLRKSLGLTGPKIGELTDGALKHSALSRLEQGVMNWHLNHLVMLGEAFSADPIYFLENIEVLKARVLALSDGLERIRAVMSGQGPGITAGRAAQLECKPLFKYVPLNDHTEDGRFSLVQSSTETINPVLDERGHPKIFGFRGTLEHLKADLEKTWHWTTDFEPSPSFAILELQVHIADGFMEKLTPWCCQRAPDVRAPVYEVVMTERAFSWDRPIKRAGGLTGSEEALLSAYRNRDSASLLRLASERLNP